MGRALVSRHEASALRRTLRRAARDLVPGEGYEVSVALVDEPEMARLNEMYRGGRGPTDVLSFSQVSPGEPAGSAEGLLGDVVVCVPVAGRQAAERGETLLQELEILAVHGLLHLMGYDDSTASGASEMATMEKDILGRTIVL
ncbi:MAG: rRNA maturation RNase YbeY [Actinomycetota bacterium]